MMGRFARHMEAPCRLGVFPDGEFGVVPGACRGTFKSTEPNAEPGSPSSDGWDPAKIAVRVQDGMSPPWNSSTVR